MRLFCVAVLSLSILSPAHADNWPSCRGPNNEGISAEKAIPAVWSTEKNLLWKLDLPGIGIRYDGDALERYTLADA